MLNVSIRVWINGEPMEVDEPLYAGEIFVIDDLEDGDEIRIQIAGFDDDTDIMEIRLPITKSA